MTFLPIVDRELSVASRRAGTYWLRFWTALIVLGIWLFLLSVAQHTSRAEMGQLLLNALGVVALGFSMLAGVFLTADCLSEEKREGTLGLLFLTDLRSYDVVLGKLAASSLHAFFGLLATFPVLGLTVLLGGVTGREFTHLLLVFAVTLFFSLSAGMFVSAFSKDARQAMAATFFIMLFVAGVCPTLWWARKLAASVWPTSAALTSSYGDYLLLPSPVSAYQRAFDLQYRFGTGAHDFWLSLGVIFGLGVAGIVLASLMLPLAWRRQGSEAPVKARSTWKKLRSRGMSISHRTALLKWNPIYWLSVRDSAPQRTALRTLIFLGIIWAGFWAATFYPDDRGVPFSPEPPFTISLFMACGLHILFKIMVATEASRRLNLDRQSGALELLLVTPISIDSILQGQKRALTRHFRWPLLILCALNLGLCLSVTWASLHMGSTDQGLFVELFLGGVVMLLMDFHALGWVGMWCGLNSTKHSRAVTATLVRVLAPNWLAIFLLIFSRPSFHSQGDVFVVFALWFVLGGAVDVVAGIVARENLRTGFRRLVAHRYRA